MQALAEPPLANAHQILARERRKAAHLRIGAGKHDANELSFLLGVGNCVSRCRHSTFGASSSSHALIFFGPKCGNLRRTAMMSSATRPDVA
jgi:hypothetical protein